MWRKLYWKSESDRNGQGIKLLKLATGTALVHIGPQKAHTESEELAFPSRDLAMDWGWAVQISIVCQTNKPLPKGKTHHNPWWRSHVLLVPRHNKARSAIVLQCLRAKNDANENMAPQYMPSWSFNKSWSPVACAFPTLHKYAIEFSQDTASGTRLNHFHLFNQGLKIFRHHFYYQTMVATLLVFLIILSCFCCLCCCQHHASGPEFSD